MYPPLFVRPLSQSEQDELEQGLRSRDGFKLRRCQILLASAKGQPPSQIAQQVGCSAQTVRNVIRAFGQQGLNCLSAQSSRPKTVQPTFDQAKREQLRALLHRSPREFGKARSIWTLPLLSEVAQAQGITKERVSGVTIHHTLRAMGIDWKRAKTHITSPDPQYPLKKRQRDRLIEYAKRPGWGIGYLDEVWWSRFALPSVQAWSDDKPLQLESRQADKTDADPKAIACYGVWIKAFGQMLLRFVQQRPVSEITCLFLAWLCQQVQQLRVLVVVWDNATWHVSKQVREWIKDHNTQVKTSGVGVRLIICRLPVKSPWLNAIEPKWMHGKRAIIEPHQTLSAQQLKTRICDYFGCPLLEPLAKQVS
jgi:transposase